MSRRRHEPIRKPRAVTGWLGTVAVVALAALAELVVLAIQPMPAETLQAMADLGPLDGWRCSHLSTYVYEPRWGPNFDAGLIADRPEASLPTAAVDRVELNLHTGEAVVWTSDRSVFVLEPSDLTTAGGCVSRLRGWFIVEEHALG